jgi:hypothetical protein
MMENDEEFLGSTTSGTMVGGDSGFNEFWFQQVVRFWGLEFQ